jgi:hypothetical protein
MPVELRDAVEVVGEIREELGGSGQLILADTSGLHESMDALPLQRYQIFRTLC